MEQFGDLRGVFTNYSTERCKQIIMEAYEEAGVDPADVSYIEADGCAIKVYVYIQSCLFTIILKAILTVC